LYQVKKGRAVLDPQIEGQLTRGTRDWPVGGRRKKKESENKPVFVKKRGS